MQMIPAQGTPKSGPGPPDFRKPSCRNLSQLPFWTFSNSCCVQAGTLEDLGGDGRQGTAASAGPHALRGRASLGCAPGLAMFPVMKSPHIRSFQCTLKLAGTLDSPG